MRNFIPLLPVTGILNGTVPACRFVSPTLTVADAGGNAVGVARSEGVAGDAVPIDLLGTAIIETGAAIQPGSAIEADTDGRAIPHTTGVIVARMAPGESAAASGLLVEVILIPN